MGSSRVFEILDYLFDLKLVQSAFVNNIRLRMPLVIA